MEDDRRARLLKLQRMEATEAEVYRRLARMQKDQVNRSILEGISLEEERHEAVIAGMTGEKVRPDMRKVRRQIMLARLFGFTFSVKMMEATEQDAAAEYRELGLDEIAEEEEAHEENMIGMLDEERLRYSGSVVLGMSDALVELTGALAGLTFALQSLNLVALAGLVTGVSAAFSMGASEYLSSRAEKKSESAVKAAFFTWISYLITVLLLVSPYKEVQNKLLEVLFISLRMFTFKFIFVFISFEICQYKAVFLISNSEVMLIASPANNQPSLKSFSFCDV